MAARRALITGIAGQDGSLLSELLLAEGYVVFGVVRRATSEQFENLEGVRDRIELIQADLLDELSLVDALKTCRPQEVVNLASPSFVPMSWKQPVLTAEFAAVGVTALLESIRLVDPEVRFYQASSSEIFGEPREVPQTELTPFYPRSPYGVSKVFGHYITVNYRESYDLFAASGILFNHGSPRRGLEFVERKVSHGVARIKNGTQKELRLGNLDARRDWGFAGDYVDAMWRMLQLDDPQDFVVGTGHTWTVQHLCETAFGTVGLDYRDYVVQDPRFMRPAEVDLLVADPSKAKQVLGWEPKVSFHQLIEMMVEADLARHRARG